MLAPLKYDAQAAAAFYDEYGEREWTRFEDGRTPAASVATHAHYLRRFVRAATACSTSAVGRAGSRSSSPGSARRVVAADISPAQLALNARYVTEAGAGGAVEERVVADVVDLSRFADGHLRRGRLLRRRRSRTSSSSAPDAVSRARSGDATAAATCSSA